MITFFACLVLLLVGFFTYGKLVEKVFRIDDRPTPAVALSLIHISEPTRH